MSREEILKFYHHAEFFPDDEPPVGRTVTWDSFIGKVVGKHKPTARHCKTCTCEHKPSIMDDMWLVEVDSMFEGGQPVVCLAYPPSLRSVGQSLPT